MENMPELNLRVRSLINYYSDGNVSDFVKKTGIPHQNLNRCFNIDSRNHKYPEPSKDILSAILTGYPEVSPDWLLTGNGAMFKGSVKRRVVIDTVTDAPIVSQYAHAGYLGGYSDPEYLNIQPVYYAKRKYTPGNYVAFEVIGDSMDDGMKRSIEPGSLVLGRELYHEHWKNKLRQGEVFIIVHRTDGISIKEITKHEVDKGVITCHSWNPEYDDYDLFLDDVLQLFYVKEVTRAL